MLRILIILTVNRICEKILDIIPLLAKEYNIDVYNVGEMSSKSPWYGDNDPRLKWNATYFKHAKKIINGDPFINQGDKIKILNEKIDVKDYSLIIYDDNRLMPQLGMTTLYRECKNHNVPVVGNSHGNWEFNPNYLIGLNNVYDYVMLLGQKEKRYYSNYYDKNRLLCGGIPSNDKLCNQNRDNNHILIILNFLGNHTEGSKLFENYFDKRFVVKSGIEKLSRGLNLPIVVKQKTRLDDKNYKKNIDYIKKAFSNDIEVKIVSDTNGTDKLIAGSAFVISAASTLAFKPIQLNIPTCVINHSGQVGNFHDFIGLSDLNEYNILKVLNKQIKKRDNSNYIESTITGGSKFNSTKVYINAISEIINN